jgi:hypothetical protein
MRLGTARSVATAARQAPDVRCAMSGAGDTQALIDLWQTCCEALGEVPLGVWVLCVDDTAAWPVPAAAPWGGVHATSYRQTCLPSFVASSRQGAPIEGVRGWVRR